MAFEKVKKVWNSLFPSFGNGVSNSQQIPPATGGFYDVFGTPDGDTISADTSEDTAVKMRKLPADRFSQYTIFEEMDADPTISSALLMHVSHALSAKSDTGEIISIESIGDEKDSIVLDLRNSLMGMINANCQSWAYHAAKLGACYVRAYGADKQGIAMLRNDYYTHPRFLTEYCRAGETVGFASTWQQPVQGGLVLIEPWKFVGVKIPIWKRQAIEPFRVDAVPFDIANDDYLNESITESQNYGQSFLYPVFAPYTDLQEAILSLNMSRQNAALMDRLVGVNINKLDPKKAQEYINIVAKQLQGLAETKGKKSLRAGWVQTVRNLIFPVKTDGTGRLDVSTMEGNANIDGIQDVTFHVQRLGSALGIDPALLGFGELLSGGLGDGGFFRVSVLAAMKAAMLRKAVRDAVERLCEIHIAYKFGKAFLPGEKPWRVVFNSVSTALEREERENLEGRIGMATGIVQMVALYDQAFATADMPRFGNFLWTDILKVDEQKFAEMFPKSKANNKPPESEELPEGGLQPDLVAESARTAAIEQYINTLYQ